MEKSKFVHTTPEASGERKSVFYKSRNFSVSFREKRFVITMRSGVRQRVSKLQYEIKDEMVRLLCKLVEHCQIVNFQKLAKHINQLIIMSKTYKPNSVSHPYGFNTRSHVLIWVAKKPKRQFKMGQRIDSVVLLSI